MDTAGLAALIEPTLVDMGYELVRVEFISGGRTCQIMAERADRETMTVEDCADISRAVSAILDVEDPIPGKYTLEVSSPGIDRPLTRPDDFSRFAGFEAKVHVKRAIDGQRRFRGVLLGLSEDGALIRLRTDDGEVALELADLDKAKLVLTDELIDAVTTQKL